MWLDRLITIVRKVAEVSLWFELTSQVLLGTWVSITKGVDLQQTFSSYLTIPLSYHHSVTHQLQSVLGSRAAGL